MTALVTPWPCGYANIMRHSIAILAVVVAISILGCESRDSNLVTPSGVLVIEINGVIDPLTANLIERGLDEAQELGTSLVVIELDTPGGLLVSTREIVGRLLESETPVAVYVSPAGARAASAGTFLVAAANFAVMAPGTNIGAATPIMSDGRDIPSTLSRKVNEDTRAFIRSIAQTRGRNSVPLEETVSKAAAYSEQEALDVGIIDLIASDMDAMFEELDGRTTTTSSGETVVSLTGAEVRQLSRTLLEQILGILASPNVVFALFVIGGIAIIVELVLPGPLVAGTVGVIAIALAFVGFGLLPGSWLGVGLIALAMALFYAETTAPGFSLFGAGGTICLILGSIFLFGNFFSPSDLPEPSFMVSPILIATMTGLVIAVWFLFIRVLRAETGTPTGFQTEAQIELEGKLGVALSDLQPSGRVRVSNEEWTATTSLGLFINEGDTVKVVGVNEQVLIVEKFNHDSEASSQTEFVD